MVDAFSASKKVVIAEVDCDANSGLCGANSIDGYPTLKFFEKGNPTPKEYAKKANHLSHHLARYEDEPTAEGLIQFVESQGNQVFANYFLNICQELEQKKCLLLWYP